MKLTTEDTENTERATPETDAKVSGHIGFYSCATVPAELCRRMERERDEARAKVERQAERIRKLEGATNHACGTPLTRALRERDEARETASRLNRRVQQAEGIIAKAGLVENRPQHAQGRSFGRVLANYAAEQYRRERDEAREQNAKLRDIAEAAIDWLKLGNPDDKRAAGHIRAKLDQLKEGGK